MDLKRILLRLILIAAITAILAVGILVGIGPDPQHYYQGSVHKLDLLEHTPSPRIILVGGSNVAWGIDSEMMQDELKIPIINAGLDAHLGIAPMVELRNYIQSGDIIIISLEYYNFTNRNDFFGVPQYLADWIEIEPSRIWYLQSPASQGPGIYTTILQRKINRKLNFLVYDGSLSEFRGLYSSDNFNSHGDFIGHLKNENATKYNFPDAQYPVNQLDEAYSFLEEFHKYANSKGALVYYEAQAHRQTNCDLTGKKSLRKFYAVLKRRTAIPLLTNLDELCYPDDYFYDTPYHLNQQGRRIRTERLIANLKTAIAEIK
jgi:hypothetical protein